MNGVLEKGYWTTLIASSFSLVAIFILWFRERGLSDVTSSKETDLQHQQSLMEGRLTSMPPKAFVYEYIIALRRAGELRMKSKHEHKLGELSPEQVRERIRSILSTVVALTRLWDGVSRIREHVVYKANLMNVVIPEQLWEQAPQEVDDRVQVTKEPGAAASEDTSPVDQFDGNCLGAKNPVADSNRPLISSVQNEAHPYLLDTTSQRPAANDGEADETWDSWVLTSPFFLHRQSANVAWERCTGAVAIVDTQLSVSTTSLGEGGDPADHELEPIVLPYTSRKDYTNGYHHPNLPGAPLAAATGQPAYIENLSESIRNWLEKEEEVNPEISKRYLKDVSEYYKTLNGVSSLISIPVLINEKLNAVLNIQKNNESLLYNHERADMFIVTVRPAPSADSPPNWPR
ncbi:hypothetical protein [Pseudomonas sp. MF6776]|uniref:hypothetical protein n=1 Tax=Pseudomonas sp. MF6776 TaxID=2797534 RepID=UPI00190CE102|nr:hypothetical protein [Pseudomonas sp. MF6776]MBK3468174.1 hypothetical protein [Pseudomonas sp. MF6776]